MRFRAGVLLLLLAVALGVGCRKPLTPNVDRNRAPETWIVAAPQDTITQKNPDGTVIPGYVGTIPVKFHLYWAGSDVDGAVTGFYYAVVETLPQPPAPGFPIPPLPGPRASDYRYTARSDSTFIFTVSEGSPDRQHAFYIYAVDDKGKPDPTPARLLFNALDRFPPIPVLEVSQGTGPIARLLPGGIVRLDSLRVAITDSLDLGNLGAPPRDTIPSRARIDFRWRGEPTLAGSYVTGYRYKLDEPQFVSVDSSVKAVSYNTGLGGDIIRPGTKQFTLRALDVANGARTITRRFQMNFSPDTWFAGPDSNLYTIQPGRQRWLDVAWAAPPAFPGSLLSCDSLTKWPAERRYSKTFFEIYRDRVYVHVEGDTVNLNSWVILHGGGSDKDSPYHVKVNQNYPVPDTVACASAGEAKALRPAGFVGSPIGFRFQYGTLLDPDRTLFSTPSPTGLYPIFDAASVFVAPRIAGYAEMKVSGKVYVLLKAEDSDAQLDRRLVNADQARALADAYDAGDHSQEALRTKILTFYSNRDPYFNFEQPGFFPRLPEFNAGQVDSSFDRTLRLRYYATDPDPFELTTRPQGTGGPSSNTVLRYTTTVTGKNTLGRDTTYTALPVVSNMAATQTIDVPSYITGRDLSLRVQLCDCPNCETQPGTGRCVYYTIPVRIGPVAAGRASGTEASPGLAPGSSFVPGRSYAP